MPTDFNKLENISDLDPIIRKLILTYLLETEGEALNRILLLFEVGKQEFLGEDILKLIAAIDENKTLEVNRANVEAKEQNDTKELKELIEKIRVSNSYL